MNTNSESRRNGQTALIFQHQNHLPRNEPTYSSAAGPMYAFETRNGISLAWVADGHVGQMLQDWHGCCGRRYHQFRVATPSEVTLWEQGQPVIRINQEAR